MKILIISDNTKTQINGVNNTYFHLKEELTKLNHEVSEIRPENFFNFPFPFYKELKFSINTFKVGKLIQKINPDRIHIATEGPIGLSSKIYCDFNKIPYTTSYHTKFPEYIEQYTNKIVKKEFSMNYFKWFHENSQSIFVSTNSLREELALKGFKNIKMWTRGVDHNIFKYNNVKKENYPVFTYCGRVSIEKNIEFFLNLNLEGEKIVIGDGPDLKRLKNKFPNVNFVGKKNKVEISEILNKSDIFVFPSKTDTFGIVIIEALSCGLPVVAFDVTGPKDILNEDVGILSKESDFQYNCYKALSLDKNKCWEYSKNFTWSKVAEQFLDI